MELLICPNLAVPAELMQHIVHVESGANPFAIGVVDGELARQPRNMDEALATAKMLESKGYNFSVGIAQINRVNLGRYGLDSYRKAFNTCDNLAVGAQILASCYGNAHGDWGKAFSCYYSGNFATGFRDGYVQKVYASINREAGGVDATSAPASSTDQPIPLTAPPTTGSAAAVSAGRNALRPVVVYASDSARYRVALRSIAIDRAAATMMPMVLSAGGYSARSDTSIFANSVAQDSSSSLAANTAPPSASATQSPQPPNPGVSRLPPTSAPHA
ncbi:MAG: lytic transglycosylase domain-containing protein, partial [Rhodanobacter sp.]